MTCGVMRKKEGELSESVIVLLCPICIQFWWQKK